MTTNPVIVQWVDAAYYRDVVQGEPLSPCDLETVGWVVEDTDEHIALAHERGGGGYRSVTVIPKGWITAGPWEVEVELEED